MFTEIREGLSRAYSFLIEEKNALGKIDNPLVYAVFTNEDSSIRVFVVAKELKEEAVISHVESEFTNRNDLSLLPLSNIKTLRLKPTPFKPFRIKKYLENNIYQCANSDIINQYLIMNPRFEKDLFLLRLSQNLDYQAIESDRLVVSLH